MNNRQTLTLKMIRVVLATLKNDARAHRVIGLAARLARLQAHADELNDLGTAQSHPTQALTLGRDAILQRMQDTALDLASAVAIYATDTKNPELLGAVKITPSDFHNARVSHRSWLATRIANAAESILPHLDPYVTAETLLAARASIREAEDAVTQPRYAIAEKASATRRIQAALREAKETLLQIDRLLFPLRRTAPDFYADYRSARRVVGRPTAAAREPEAIAEFPPPPAVPGDSALLPTLDILSTQPADGNGSASPGNPALCTASVSVLPTLGPGG